MRSLRFALAPLAVALLALAGCGGGRSGASTGLGKGTAVLRVGWPARGRTVPLNADNVVVEISKVPASSGDTPASVTLKRSDAVDNNVNGPGVSPTVTEEKIGGLDPGVYKLVASAYAASDTSRLHPLAVGSNDGLVIVAGQRTPFTIVMASQVSRLKIEDAGVTKAFTPAVFYVDDHGPTIDGTSRVAVSYNQAVPQTDLRVTLQSEQAGDLSLFPPGAGAATNANSLFSVSGPGFSATTNEAPAGETTYRTTLSFTPPVPPIVSSTLTFEYRDYEVNESGVGGNPLLKEFAVPVQVNAPVDVTVKLAGLPASFNDSDYVIVTKLKERNAEPADVDQTPGVLSFDGEQVDGTPSQVRFDDVSNPRNRLFDLTATLQFVSGGKTYTLASRTFSKVSLTADNIATPLTFIGDNYSTYTINFVGTVNPDLSSVQGKAATYDAYMVKISIGSKTISLPADLFVLTPDNVSIANAAGVSVQDNYKIAVSLQKLTADKPVKLNVAFSRPNPTNVSPVAIGSFIMTVRRNTNGLGVTIQ